ncbi:Chromatin-remodeling ATPase INO80 [Labeo rohita]|uniref:Chromatin-remodeling ATPase INO80 n=1 Tax=Labeo rohita TaxID=84645 RepID=A0ABQ8LEV5_LABRO|nr:Chromatin-remodeling ATPase INO80 [Labeo rohita]
MKQGSARAWRKATNHCTTAGDLSALNSLSALFRSRRPVMNCRSSVRCAPGVGSRDLVCVGSTHHPRNPLSAAFPVLGVVIWDVHTQHPRKSWRSQNSTHPLSPATSYYYCILSLAIICPLPLLPVSSPLAHHLCRSHLLCLGPPDPLRHPGSSLPLKKSHPLSLFCLLLLSSAPFPQLPPTICVVRVCQSWLEDPPPASESRTLPQSFNPATPPQRLPPSSLLGSLISPAPPWSVVDYPPPLDSTPPALLLSSSSTLVLCRSGYTAAFQIPASTSVAICFTLALQILRVTLTPRLSVSVLGSSPTCSAVEISPSSTMTLPSIGSTLGCLHGCGLGPSCLLPGSSLCLIRLGSS